MEGYVVVACFLNADYSLVVAESIVGREDFGGRHQCDCEVGRLYATAHENLEGLGIQAAAFGFELEFVRLLGSEVHTGVMR